MRFLVILLLSYCALFSNDIDLSDDEKQWIQNNKIVTFTGDPNWLPYEAFNDRGHYIGIVADYLKIIENKTGLRFVPHVVNSWSESLTVASQGKVSVVSGDIADIVLNKHLRPITPYLISPIVIIMNHDTFDEHDYYVESFESLQDKKIAIIKGYGYTADVFKTYPTMNYIEVENIQEGLRGLSAGKYDAMLASHSLASYTISKMNSHDLKIVGKTSVIMSVTLFVDKSMPLLHSIINKTITSISSKEEQKIRDKWINSSKVILDYQSTLIIILLILFSFIILVKLYRKAVKAKEQYTFSIEASQDALWNWNIKTDETTLSPRFRELFCLSEDKNYSKGSTWIESIHPDDKDSFMALIEDNLKGNSNTFDTQYRIQTKNGSWTWVQTRAKTFYDLEGKPSRMDGICRDITKEKELSLQLIKSRKLLRTIIDNIPIRIFWKDTEGVYLGYNKLFATDIGQNTDHSHIGKTDYEMPWKDEAQGYIDDDTEIITSATAKLDIEEQHTRPDGHKEWVSTSKVPLIDDNGEVYGIIGAYYDVTEHKNHLIENEKVKKRLETAQELSHMGSWEWDMISGDLTWSDEVYRIFGEEPQSFTATYEAFVSYIPIEYQEGLSAAISKAMETKEPYQFDHEVRRKDGKLRLVREAGYVRFNKEGEPISMLGTVMDINSIVTAEAAIRENKELTRRLQQFDENIIASNTDIKGIITYASEAFAKISGYTLDELVGSPSSIVRCELSPKELFEDLWKTIQSGSIWSGEIRNKAKDGSTYWVDTTISPILNTKDEIIGYSSIRRDITHEKQVHDLHSSLEKKSLELQSLNDDLERRVAEAVTQSKQKDHLMAQQSKLASMGEMIGNIAHQWRQPLNALSLLLQKQQVFFERGVLTAEKIQESTDKGVKLITKMSTTIDDFRDFFKPNKQKEYFDIKHAIENTLELINAALYDKDIKLILNVNEGDIIYGYENEFSQVILNIINNAKDVLVENKIENSTIKIDTSRTDKVISVHISDNAGGIPDNVIDKIFEPYYTTKEEGKGTGIGLYMSKMIIEDNMNGTIQVANNRDGAIFTITFDIIQKDLKEQGQMV